LTRTIRICVCIFAVAALQATVGLCADEAPAPSPSPAAETAKPIKPAEPATPWKGFAPGKDKLPERTDLFRQFATAIGFVLVLGVGAFYVSRRLGPRWSASRGRNLRIIETIGLGPHRHIHLLEVEGRRLVIGSTAQTIGLIAELGPGGETKGETPQ
jgi:flagellar biogenesis protein FliO